MLKRKSYGHLLTKINVKLLNLQWRLSIPIMVMVLNLVGVPLSRVNPRVGKYAKLLPAIIIFIVYANFLFIARDCFTAGKIPAWLGLWWVHVPVILLGLYLIKRTRLN